MRDRAYRLKHKKRKKGGKRFRNSDFLSLVRGCGNKKSYPSRRIASAKARHLNKIGHVVQPYKCKHCHVWHLTKRKQ